jgi:hypothetical protein
MWKRTFRVVKKTSGELPGGAVKPVSESFLLQRF